MAMVPVKIFCMYILYRKFTRNREARWREIDSSEVGKSNKNVRKDNEEELCIT
jgi:hypothetical protein